MREVNGLKIYSLDEVVDRTIGKKGTPAREKFEFNLQMEIIGEMIKDFCGCQPIIFKLQLQITHDASNQRRNTFPPVLIITKSASDFIKIMLLCSM